MESCDGNERPLCGGTAGVINASQLVSSVMHNLHKQARSPLPPSQVPGYGSGIEATVKSPPFSMIHLFRVAPTGTKSAPTTDSDNSRLGIQYSRPKRALTPDS